MTIDLHVIADGYFEKSIDAVDAYFPNEAEKIAQACQAMALRFEDGGRLLAFGAGNAGTDALHLSVEFVHPVLVGKRALPAIALDRNLTSYATQIAAFGQFVAFFGQFLFEHSPPRGSTQARSTRSLR